MCTRKMVSLDTDAQEAWLPASVILHFSASSHPSRLPVGAVVLPDSLVCETGASILAETTREFPGTVSPEQC